MGILSNTVSMVQFQVVGEMPKDNLINWVGTSLSKRGFQDIENSSEEVSAGWVHLDNPEEVHFGDPNTYVRDQYFGFTFRKDQRKVPASLLKAHVKKAEKAYLDSHPGLQRVPKQEREEIKDRVRMQLMSKTLPTPSSYDIVWDTGADIVTVATLSSKTLEEIEALFKATFDGLRLVSIHPYARAQEVVDSSLTQALENANQAADDTVLNMIKDNQWIGWGFFKWLVDRTLESSSEYIVTCDGPAPDGAKFVAYLNARLMLAVDKEGGQQTVAVAGPQDRFDEVLIALEDGKNITEATLFIEHEENTWKLTLKGETFNFGSYKTPSVKLEKDDVVDEEAEKAAVFYEKMLVMEKGLQFFNSLFAAYLKERLS